MAKRHGNTDDTEFEALPAMLLAEGMPAQAVIGREAGVSQSTVSRAARGLIRGRSKGAAKLVRYARGRALLLGPGGTAKAEGGDTPATPRGSEATSGSATDTGGKDSRADAGGLPIEDASGHRERLNAEAMAGLRDYLADEFDPQLVVEQLAVLRRAQGQRRNRARRPDGHD